MTDKTRAMVFEGFDAAKAGDAGFHVVMVGPDATPDDVQAFRDAYELGLAWAEAEAALRFVGDSITLTSPEGDHAKDGTYTAWNGETITATGPTPAAALRALAARLREGRP